MAETSRMSDRIQRALKSPEQSRLESALQELRDSRRSGDRFAMIREAAVESTRLRIPTRSSIAFRVLDEAIEPAVERAQDAHYTAVTAAGGKRKASSAGLEDAIDNYKQSLSHIDTSEMYFDLHCDQIRAKITKVVESGVFKKTEFCGAIEVSNASVNIFLKMRGAFRGATSKAFIHAWDWFKQREIAGLKLPDPNKRRQTAAVRAALTAATADGASYPGASAGASTSATASALVSPISPAPNSGSTSGAPPSIPDIGGIHLPGEDTDEVPVYDTCTEVREKIDAHLLAHKGLTQAQFCRDIYAHGLKSPTRCKGIQPKQLSDFRHKQGSNAGATSSVFYAASVYFEKIRLAQGAPKSAHRLEMERRWGPEGFDRDHDDRAP
ncbi:uncharacterized protein PG986_014047 [Apiospora aurea]|uniref:DUF7726 domain-containing protein n=1 Tax=Apiospora aurea TaxID=335848 RepID=A0ABR1PSW6_9PEZI